MKLFGTVRWAVGGLLFLGGMINYLDRAALSVAVFVRAPAGSGRLAIARS